MKYNVKRMSYCLPIAAAAIFALAFAPAHARDAKELLLKSVGTDGERFAGHRRSHQARSDGVDA